MRSLGWSLVLFSFVGCATTSPTLKRTVDPARIARLDPAALQPAETAHTAALAEVERDEGKAKERVSKSEAVLKTTEAEHPLGDQHVQNAKIDRARAEVAWQRSMLDVIAWRRAIADAAYELARAQVVARTGADIDLEAFRAQGNDMRRGLKRAEADQVSSRSRFEAADRRLNEAKARYAGATAQATSTPPAQ
jgi:hypothetical protein